MASARRAHRTNAMLMAFPLALSLMINCAVATAVPPARREPVGNAPASAVAARPPTSDARLLVRPPEWSKALTSAASASPKKQTEAARAAARRITKRLDSVKGNARLRLIEGALLEAGVSLYDGGSSPKLVYRARRSDRPTYLQAAQVRAIALAQPSATLSVAAVVGTLRTGLRALAPVTAPQLSDKAARIFLLSALDGPVAGLPDRVLRELLRAGDPTDGPTLQAALATPGVDYQLTPLQAQLLLVRARADALLLTGWYRQQARVPPATSRATTSSRATGPATEHAFAKDACAVDAIPEFIYSVIASIGGAQLAKKLAPRLKELDRYIGKIKVIYAEGQPGVRVRALRAWGLAMGVVSVLGTLVNAAAMNQMFVGTVVAKPQPLLRTKSTTEDGGTIGLSAHFEWADRGLGSSRWWNCVAKLASVLGVDSVLNNPGPIKDSPVEWNVAGGPATPAKPTGSTNSAGDAHTDLVGNRQLKPVPAEAKLLTMPDLTATAIVHPQKLSELLIAIGAEVATGLTGGPAGVALVGLDVLLKSALAAMDAFGVWNAKSAVGFADWVSDQMVLSAELHISESTGWAGPIAHSETTSQFVLHGQVATREGEPLQGLMQYGTARRDSSLFSNNPWAACDWPNSDTPGTCTVTERLTGTRDGSLAVETLTDDGQALWVAAKLDQLWETNTRSCSGRCGYSAYDYEDQQALILLNKVDGKGTSSEELGWSVRLILVGWDEIRNDDGSLASATLNRSRTVQVGGGTVTLAEAWTLKPMP